MKKDNPLNALVAFVFLIILGSLKKKTYPKLIYHYTNVHGAFGIIDNSRLWSTGAYVLNDTREIEYGIDLLRSALKSVRSTSKTNKKFGAFLSRLEAFMQDPSAHVHRVNSIFVASFCEVPDALRQWRAYASGGDGYCLAFDPEQMETLRVRQAPDGFTLDLFKVEYRPEKQTELLFKSLTEFGNAFETEDVYALIDATSFAWLAWETLFSIVLTFKHPTFEDENEWRLIVRPHPVLLRQPLTLSESNRLGFKFKPCFNTTSGYLRHYVELEQKDGSPLPIKSVCLGPKIYDPNAEAIFRMLSMSRGYQLEELTRSSCRLR